MTPAAGATQHRTNPARSLAAGSRGVATWQEGTDHGQIAQEEFFQERNIRLDRRELFRSRVLPHPLTMHLFPVVLMLGRKPEPLFFAEAQRILININNTFQSTDLLQRS